MCVVSMVGDHYRDNWTPKIPEWFPNGIGIGASPAPAISREEFDQLKRQVEEMKELLKRAKAYDERNGEPDCEVDEKMALLRKIAALVGVSLDDVIGKSK